MTIWTPDLSARSGPKYQAIAEALAEDIGSGALAAGTRLPPHRDLAWRLGVTVGTVSRAYALAQARGLIAGTVGRGTVVLPMGGGIVAAAGPANEPVPAFFPRPGPQAIEMGRNYPSDGQTVAQLAEAMRKMANPAFLAQMGGYHPPNGTAAQREAGARWLAYCGLDAPPGEIIVVNGCQHALAVAMSTLTRAGDTVLAEELTWPGAVNLAGTLGVKLRPLAMDGDGLRPDGFEKACREDAPRLLYTVPTMQNPTTTVMPEARRREIAAIARAHDVTILEDNVFGFLIADAPPAFKAIAPDITVYAASLSKAVLPSLRAGYLWGPAEMLPRFALTIQSTTIMPPMVGAQLAAELLLSGAVAEAAGRQRRIAVERMKLAREIIGDRTSPPVGASQLWLPLPAQWTDQAFAAECLSRGVAVSAGSAFRVDRTAGDTGAIRVCLTAEPDVRRIEQGLRTVAGLLETHPTAGAPIV